MDSPPEVGSSQEALRPKATRLRREGGPGTSASKRSVVPVASVTSRV